MTLRLTLEELRTLFKCILLDNTHKDIFNAQFELFQFAQTGELVLRYKGSSIVLLQKFGPSSSACLLSSYDLQHVLGFCPLPDSSTSAFFTNMCTGFHPQLREWVLMYKGQDKLLAVAFWKQSPVIRVEGIPCNHLETSSFQVILPCETCSWDSNKPLIWKSPNISLLEPPVMAWAQVREYGPHLEKVYAVHRDLLRELVSTTQTSPKDLYTKLKPCTKYRLDHLKCQSTDCRLPHSLESVMFWLTIAMLKWPPRVRGARRTRNDFGLTHADPRFICSNWTGWGFWYGKVHTQCDPDMGCGKGSIHHRPYRLELPPQIHSMWLIEQYTLQVYRTAEGTSRQANKARMRGLGFEAHELQE